MAKKDWMIKESELDEDQIRVLMATNQKSLVISGCAGSGKSVLALIKAQRIQKEIGNNYQIIVFTKALCGYMNAGRRELGLNNEFYYHWEWKNKRNCPSADFTIVDEIQDFTVSEIQEFVSKTRKQFFFFGDTAQSIYDGLKDTMSVEELKKIYTVKSFDLYRNYRLPRPVAKIVQYVGRDLDGFDIETYKSSENSIPRIIKCSSFENQIDVITRIIKRQNTDIGILVKSNEQVKGLHVILNEKGINHELKYDDKDDWRNNINTLDFSTENPKIMTYHSAKGLQFGTVIMPQISPLSFDRKRRVSDQKALYVAMTRTCQNLYLLYSGSLPEPLSNIPTNLYKQTEIDQVEDI